VGVDPEPMFEALAPLAELNAEDMDAVPAPVDPDHA
jgi:hypothetical protein